MNKQFMKLAIEEAKIAALKGEVPVGAVIVKDGKVIAKGHNTRETEQSALGHAEINAIKEACEKLNSWRLDDCQLYVTMEPCPMCAGAIINARIPTVVFGSYDLNYGALGSKIDLREIYNSKLNVYGGIMEEECDKVLSECFEGLR